MLTVGVKVSHAHSVVYHTLVVQQLLLLCVYKHLIRVIPILNSVICRVKWSLQVQRSIIKLASSFYLIISFCQPRLGNLAPLWVRNISIGHLFVNKVGVVPSPHMANIFTVPDNCLQTHQADITVSEEDY